MASFTCPRPHQSLASTRLFLTFCDLPDLWRQVLVLATDASSAFNLSRVRVLDFKESKCLPLSGVKAGRNWPGNCLAPSPMKTANTHTHTEAKKGLSWVLVSGSPICLTFCQLSTGHQLSTGWFFFSYFFSLFLFFFFHWSIVDLQYCVSGIQKTDLIIHTCIYIHSFFSDSFHYRLLHDIECSSLCYTENPCCLSILCMVVCIC